MHTTTTNNNTDNNYNSTNNGIKSNPSGVDTPFLIEELS